MSGFGVMAVKIFWKTSIITFRWENIRKGFANLIVNARIEMKVILNDSIYEMDKKQFRSVLDIAKKSVKMGIYAVEKDGIAEMKNEKFESKEDLKKSVAEYEKNGFKVYHNE